MLKAIQRYKKQSNLSYYDLALDIGIAETTLYRFCRGEYITPKILTKIEQFMKEVQNDR